MRFLSAGDCALLVELDDLDQALALYRAVGARPISGVEECVPAARTVLVRHDPAAVTRARLLAALAERGRAAASSTTAVDAAQRTVEIPVHYHGEDLAEVAQLLHLSEREVIARHTGRPWQAAFPGFAPGFVYLAEGDACFAAIPRRAAPRVRVPARSVALAGNLSGVYPHDSPGGWQLIGRTDLAMWDMARAEPALIQPGMQVQFIDADAAGAGFKPPPAVAAKAPREKRALALPRAQQAIEIVQPGLQTLVQDEGRPGQAQRGVSASGALDRGALHEANRLVGNPADSAALENTLGGLALRAHGEGVLVAVSGASVALSVTAAKSGGREVSGAQAIALADGDVLELGHATAGVRCYVAVRGGWRVGSVLGSCSTDTLAQIGPPPLRAKAHIAVGDAIPARALRKPGKPAAARVALPRRGDTVVLDIVLGPRTDWFAAEAVDLLTQQPWRVTPRCDRVGMRLEGTKPLQRTRHDELPSEGTMTGAIQVPASGQPVLFLADHPLTGGYPVIAVVARHHLDLAAQIPIGCDIRFRVAGAFFDETRD